MEMTPIACDMPSGRSGKILQPENDLGQGFRNFALARVLFAGSMFFDKVSISRLSRLQKVRIRMREADAPKITKKAMVAS